MRFATRMKGLALGAMIFATCPPRSQGTLQIGTPLAPIGANVSAEIVIANQTLDTSDDGMGVFDPRQNGTGLIAIDGQVLFHGEFKTGYQRLAVEPSAGDVVLRLHASDGPLITSDKVTIRVKK